MQAKPQDSLSIQISGIVQGVGCRPAIKRLADKHRLRGWVRNSGTAVQVYVRGEQPLLQRFYTALVETFPQQTTRLLPHNFEHALSSTQHAFVIEPSLAKAQALAITPDLALCSACLAELLDKNNRRYRYPFISCTQCGPRYSISISAPFDRERTALKAFAPCSACSSEYTDPQDRRYHAQTIACHTCGPQVKLLDGNGQVLQAGDDWPQQAVQTLRSGGVIALKTAGGFQLYALASDHSAVAKIRQIKQRPHKPLALLLSGIKQIAQHCSLDANEQALLRSPSAPLVILRAKHNAASSVEGNASNRAEHDSHDIHEGLAHCDNEAGSQQSSILPGIANNIAPGIANNIATGNPYFAVMMPHHPLQHLLMQALNEPLVATSANRSGEALLADDANLLGAFAGQLDLVITHNLPIHRALDDSIFQIAGGRAMCLRAGRGVAPIVMDLALHSGNAENQAEKQAAQQAAGLLALGAQLKNSVAIAHNNQIMLSQYHGDLDTISTLERQEQTINDFTQVTAPPLHVIVDAHPQRQAITDTLKAKTITAVQHHEAHARACQLEHAIKPAHLAVVWDGFGYGSANCMWGGEFFLLHDSAIAPFAHLAALTLPGGDMAMREPRRMALAALWPLHEVESFNQLESIYGQNLFTHAEQKLLTALLRRATMTTRAAGRWFDAIACLLGVAQINRFEADAAMQLQFLAEQAPDTKDDYAVAVDCAGPRRTIDLLPLVEQVLADQSPLPVKARRFHNSLATTIATLAKLAQANVVSLSGGCFQNRLLLELCQQQLQRQNIRCYWPEKIPINDGGIAAGQVYAGLLRQAGINSQTGIEKNILCV